MKRSLTAYTWWIAHDNGENVAYGYSIDEVWTSREIWETYDSEEAWKTRLSELGVELSTEESDTPEVPPDV